MVMNSANLGKIFSRRYWQLRNTGLNKRHDLSTEEQAYADVEFPDGGGPHTEMTGRGIGREPTTTEYDARDNPRRRG